SGGAGGVGASAGSAGQASAGAGAGGTGDCVSDCEEPPVDIVDRGCGCRVGASHTGAAALWGLGLLVVLSRRRRRSARA
ncbi:MAG: hypothetical protein KC492_45530, partial [Myxococcales bacterium]|nr:hypothetical protein [Myxococcales bacterium]